MFTPTNANGVGEATRRDTSRSPVGLLDGSQRRAVVSEMRKRPTASETGGHLTRQAQRADVRSHYSWVSQHSLATASGFGGASVIPLAAPSRPGPLAKLSGVTSILRETGMFGRDGVPRTAAFHREYGTHSSISQSIISRMNEAARNDGALAPSIGLIADAQVAGMYQAQPAQPSVTIEDQGSLQ